MSYSTFMSENLSKTTNWLLFAIPPEDRFAFLLYNTGISGDVMTLAIFLELLFLIVSGMFTDVFMLALTGKQRW